MVGRKVLIIGASGGVGSAVVNRFKLAGYSLCCVARTSDRCDWISALSPSDKLVLCDLRDRESRKLAWTEIIKWSRSIDVLVHAAGVGFGSNSMMTSLHDISAVFEVNFLSVIDFAQRASRVMMRKQNGSIISISSIQGSIAEKGNLAYGTSKAALNHATRILASEFAKYGIRVNAISPTMIKTKMLNNLDKSAKDKLMEYSAARAILDPEEVAELVYFLTLESSRSINGQIIRIDGGMPF